MSAREREAAMTAYKWFLPGRVTPVRRATWPVRVKQWTPDESPVLCESGWHGVERKDVLTHLPGVSGAELWRVEVRGEIVHGDDKFAATSMRLVELVAKPDERTVRLFACDVAEDVLPLFEARFPEDARIRETIEVVRRYAVGEATQEELSAAGKAAGAARNAAGNAAGAAGDAAWEAARAAGYAAWKAAGDAAWEAARAAGYAAGVAAGIAAGAAAWAAAGIAAGAAARAAAGAKYNEWLCERLGL